MFQVLNLSTELKLSTELSFVSSFFLQEETTPWRFHSQTLVFLFIVSLRLIHVALGSQFPQFYFVQFNIANPTTTARRSSRSMTIWSCNSFTFFVFILVFQMLCGACVVFLRVKRFVSMVISARKLLSSIKSFLELFSVVSELW